MSNIILKNICKIYPGNIEALSDFSLEIFDKEFIVLVGPSGCGKTTALRIIAGLEDANKGEVYIDNRPVNKAAPNDRNVAMVFQNHALYPHMSVYKNMEFGLNLHKVAKDEIQRRILEAADILEIGDLLNRKPSTLSGGQSQRVALGCALVRNPGAFLLDEPLSNLDARLRSSMRAEIMGLHKKLAATFVYVTHDQMEALTMGDRIVVINKGRIQQIDTPINIYNHPGNTFVAGFIGSPPMNFMRGTLLQEINGYIVDFDGFKIKIPADKINCHDLSKYNAKKIDAGIRPEDIDVGKYVVDEQIEPATTALVETCEFMGAETYLNLRLRGMNITAQNKAKADVRAGETITISFNASKLHLFDIETGTSLLGL